MRYHHVRKTHGGEEHLAERSDINHTSVAIDALKRLCWTTAISEFTQVIVLDDPRTSFSCKRDELSPSLGRHRDAERELMRRCDVDETRIVVELLALVD